MPQLALWVDSLSAAANGEALGSASAGLTGGLQLSCKFVQVGTLCGQAQADLSGPKA